jgi:hypothetical protein
MVEELVIIQQDSPIPYSSCRDISSQFPRSLISSCVGASQRPEYPYPVPPGEWAIALWRSECLRVSLGVEGLSSVVLLFDLPFERVLLFDVLLSDAPLDELVFDLLLLGGMLSAALPSNALLFNASPLVLPAASELFGPVASADPLRAVEMMLVRVTVMIAGTILVSQKMTCRVQI